MQDQYELRSIVAATPNAVYLSALTRDGIPYLMDRITEMVKSLVVQMDLSFPYSRSELVAFCYEFGVVQSVDYQPEAIHVKAEIARSLTGRLEDFWLNRPPAQPKPKEAWEE